jgi:prepilin-type N-terminal cleavage/methylation domain-containing protein
MRMFLSGRGRRAGFTLVELAVVIVIIGVLASFGVPKFMQSVERSKAVESFNFLSALRSAEERHLAKEGSYTTDWKALDVQWKMSAAGPVLQYFSIGSDFVAGASTWGATLTRTGAAGSYGAYTVSYSSDGFLPSTVSGPGGVAGSTIPGVINPLGSQTEP